MLLLCWPHLAPCPYPAAAGVPLQACSEARVRAPPMHISLASPWPMPLQAFPFEGCPPTTAAPSESPGLRHVLAAVREALPGMGTASRNSLTKVGWVEVPGWLW